MLLSEEDDILRRWAEHFDLLLNTEPSNQNTINQETYQVFPATDEPIPTFNEVENAIQKLKDNKAPVELIKKAFNSLEKTAKDMNLFMNQEKTKYMTVTKKSHANYPHHL